MEPIQKVELRVGTGVGVAPPVGRQRDGRPVVGRELLRSGEQGAEVTSGDEVGEVVVGVGAGECVEDFVDVERDFGGVEPAKVAPECAPPGEVGIDVAFGDRGRAVDGGFGRVVAAKGLVAVGGGAAFSAVAADEGTFGSHGASLRQVTGCRLQAAEKPRLREAFWVSYLQENILFALYIQNTKS